jgi:alkaline phosphatase
VTAGITVLDNDDGFFMMVEGGKIDWSCNANDAATTIQNTIAFSDAVQVAVDFAAAHPGECLIITTADHETGGLTIGFATTAYDTHFNYLSGQTISYVDFGSVVADMQATGATFDDALAAIQKYYGLTTEAGRNLSLTADDVAALQAAFNYSMAPDTAPAEESADYAAYALSYGGYDPLSVTVSHIMNNKAGLSYTSYAHTGLPVSVYATGVGAEAFAGSYDDTAIFDKTMNAMGLGK